MIEETMTYRQMLEGTLHSYYTAFRGVNAPETDDIRWVWDELENIYRKENENV